MRADSGLVRPDNADPRWLGLEHGQFRFGRQLPSHVRPVVAASWQRCADLHLDGRLPPVRLDADGLAERRADHPLSALLPMFRDLLGDDDHVFAITDETGTLLWVEGDATTRRRAERMNFVPGAAWSEAEAGTNAPGTALRLLRPVQVVAAEHYNSAARAWSCAAAPVRDLATGQVLGVIDITGGDGVSSPHALGLVRAIARLAETELARPKAGEPIRDVPAPPRRIASPTRPDRESSDAIRLTALGRDCAQVEADGRVINLRPRHSEIAVILALGEGGLPGPRLAVQLSETDNQPVTLRAEMSRLRAQLRSELLGSRPYDFLRPVSSDFAAVQSLLDQGQVADALAAYPGPLLPSSQAPAVADRRAALQQQLRAEVLASGSAGLLRQWVNASWGADDIEAWQTLAKALPAGSPQRSAAVARARTLDRELGLPQTTGPAVTVMSRTAEAWRGPTQSGAPPAHRPRGVTPITSRNGPLSARRQRSGNGGFPSVEVSPGVSRSAARSSPARRPT